MKPIDSSTQKKSDILTPSSVKLSGSIYRKTKFSIQTVHTCENIHTPDVKPPHPSIKMQIPFQSRSHCDEKYMIENIYINKVYNCCPI